MTMIVRLLAVAVAVGVVAANISLPECDREVCNCPKPNVMPGDLSAPQSGNSSCACTCGRKVGVNCEYDGHCAKGSYCGAPMDITQMSNRKLGICTDQCKRKRCPAFNKCVINDDGDAVCECQLYDCEVDDSKIPAFRAQQGNRVLAFQNMCRTVNVNCKQFMNNPNSQPWRFV